MTFKYAWTRIVLLIGGFWLIQEYKDFGYKLLKVLILYIASI